MDIVRIHQVTGRWVVEEDLGSMLMCRKLHAHNVLGEQVRYFSADEITTRKVAAFTA